jgi:IS5 family transposase
MIYTKDHKTLNMFDPLDHLGPKRRKLLEQSWSFLFRREILSNLPVDQILPYYASDNGAPTKELYSMLGLMLLQQSFDLTDKEAIKQFAFNFEWHYALGIKDESDKSTYVSEKTLWNTRHLLTENDLYQSLFDIPTRQLADLCGVDPSRQRLDSVHIFSNMRHLGRIGLFVRTIKKFLQYLKRHHPGTSGFGRLEKSLRDRYLSKEESSVFSMVKPSETPKTLQNLAEDLFSIIRCYRDDPKVTSMKYYKLMLRLLEEQCIVGNEQDDGEKITIKPNREVPSDSLQNPSDPDATYDGHKGKGYQVQVAETYRTGDEAPALSLITHINVEPAHHHDSEALVPAIERTKKMGFAPKQMLADAAYGSDENHQQAAGHQVELIAPVPGKEPKIPIGLTEFKFSDKGKMIACPLGHAPIKLRNNKKSCSVFFDRNICSACTQFDQCPVKEGTRGCCIRFNQKQLRTAKRRALETTPEFKNLYRYRSGIEATFSEFDRKTGVKHLRFRGLKKVTFCATLKAAGINLFRANAFINRKNTDEPGPNRPFSLLVHTFEVFKNTINRFQHGFVDRFEKNPFLRTGILQNLNPTGFQRV